MSKVIALTATLTETESSITIDAISPTLLAKSISAAEKEGGRKVIAAAPVGGPVVPVTVSFGTIAAATFILLIADGPLTALLNGTASFPFGPGKLQLDYATGYTALTLANASTTAAVTVDVLIYGA